MDKLVNFRKKTKEQFFIDEIGIYYLFLGAIVGFLLPERALHQILGFFIGSQLGLTYGFIVGYGIVGGKPESYRPLETCLVRSLLLGVPAIVLFTLVSMPLINMDFSVMPVVVSAVLGALALVAMYKTSFAMANGGK